MKRYRFYHMDSIRFGEVQPTEDSTGAYVLYKDAEQRIGDLSIKLLKLETEITEASIRKFANRYHDSLERLAKE